MCYFYNTRVKRDVSPRSFTKARSDEVQKIFDQDPSRSSFSSFLRERLLLASERDERIEGRRSACGQIAGGQTDDRKEGRRPAEYRRVERRHTEEEYHQRLTRAGGEQQADRAADDRQTNPTLQNHTDDIDTPRAQRHPDADFTPTAGNRVRSDSVNPDRRQQRTDNAEPAGD